MAVGNDGGSRRTTRPRYANWAGSREDARDYARLLSKLRGGIRPVRPLGRPPEQTRGQLPLFADSGRRVD